MGEAAAGGLVVCVDVGSTWTKAALVGLPQGLLRATASHPTTHPVAGVGDVMDGVDACVARLAETEPAAAYAEVRGCSSAGGGLRIGVVGHEQLVSAEAGRRVALSAGGTVAHVWHGRLDAAGIEALAADRPDVLLLLGGTDGGNAEVLLANARTLAAAGWPGPVVVAGNVAVRDEVAALLDGAGVPTVLADNVLPRIGVLNPGSARAAIRAMFLAHVIGGKELSARPEFTALVRGATPDLVLTAVELLAAGDGATRAAGDVVVLDVGGATTDVHSVVTLDPEDVGLAREVVASAPATRTVEADLGLRWSAATTYAEALAAGVWTGPDPAPDRHRDPGYLPDTAAGAAVDDALARAAMLLAVRRHAGRARVVTGPDGRVVERSGVDLRPVGLVVGSGGVLRHRPDADARALLAVVAGPDRDGWQRPETPSLVVDADYVLAPAGLLAADHPRAAHALLGRLRGTAAPATAVATVEP